MKYLFSTIVFCFSLLYFCAGYHSGWVSLFDGNLSMAGIRVAGLADTKLKMGAIVGITVPIHPIHF